MFFLSYCFALNQPMQFSVVVFSIWGGSLLKLFYNLGRTEPLFPIKLRKQNKRKKKYTTLAGYPPGLEKKKKKRWKHYRINRNENREHVYVLF